MKKVLSFFLFFPSITFGLSSVEIFPWGVIYAFTQLPRIHKITLFIGFILIISSVITGIAYSGIYMFESFRTSLAYLNVLIPFLIILNSSEETFLFLAKIIRIVLFTLISVGLIQLLVGNENFGYFLSFFIPRAEGGVFGGGRGVSLLSSEPPRAAIELLFLYASYRIFLQDSGSSVSKLLIYDLLIIFFILLIVGSAVGTVVSLVYIIALYRFKALLPFLIIGTIFYYYFLDTDIRAISVFYNIFQFVTYDEIFQQISNSSGFRVISVMSAYEYAIQNPFGGGIGSWPATSIEALNASGVSPDSLDYFQYGYGGEFIPLRPSSFMANIALDVGLVGILIVTGFIFYSIRNIILNKKYFPFVVLFLFSIYIVGAAGNPVPWVTLAVLIRYSAYNNHLVSQNA